MNYILADGPSGMDRPGAQSANPPVAAGRAASVAVGSAMMAGLASASTTWRPPGAG
jgi:hypothetical protein